MNFERVSEGFAVLCDRQGNIRRLLHDSIGVDEDIEAGRPFTRLIDRQSMRKALDMLVELRQEGSAFDWELAIPHESGTMVLHCAGFQVNGDLLIVGSRNRVEVMAFYEDLMKINNEQMNALRRLSKDRVEASRERGRQDQDVYDELSRLNNELVNLQRELSRKNARLEELNQLKSEFVGMAAHDLRNPLAAILSYSEFLIEQAGPDMSEEHRNFLEIILGSSEFMLQMVNDLLDITTIESGELTLEPQPTDVLSLLEDNLAVNRMLAEKKSIRVEFEKREPLPDHLLLDRSKFEQVLNNLLSNAIKYSYPESVVCVWTEVRDGEWWVAVEDEGQGIAEDELEAVFRIYDRTSARGTAGERSTGLGLAITKRIVEGHGGRIWVESEEGVGSTFYVALPLPESEGAGVQESDSGSETARDDETPSHDVGMARRVLVADDDQIGRRVTRKMLERQGCLVTVVGNGREALERWEAEPFDVLFLDVHMPEMDGLEVTRTIRSREAEMDGSHHIPIVALTAGLQQSEREGYLDAGMDASVGKPLRAPEIAGTLERLAPLNDPTAP
jgi:signal transduction histidine kinase/CheY-like chemotaxis protein